MRRHDNGIGSLTVAVVLVASLAGCAAPRPRPTPAAQAPVLPPVAQPPAPPPPKEAEGRPSLPPVSVGPRAEAAEAPPAVESKPPPPPTAPPLAPELRGRYVVLNFDNADIETVIHAASEILGFNYVLAPDVRGKVTVQTSGRIPQEDVFGVLLAILEVHGFTAVKSGDLYKIVRIEGARERAVPTIIGATPDPARTTDEVVTQIVPLRYAAVNNLAALLRPLISTRGNLLTHRETNVLMITDSASNIARLLEIVRLVDVPVAVEELQIIPVTFADATDLANILNQLFASGRIRAAAPPGVAPPPPPPTAPGTLRPPTAPAAPGEAPAGERPPLIISDRRSNSLIVHASRHEVETIRRLIAQLDVNITGGRRVFIYYAENAKAKDLAATLNAIYGAKETVSTTAPSQPPAPRRPGESAPPPPSAPSGPYGGPAAGGPTGTPGVVGTAEVGLAEGQIRFIADETTNAVIVTTYPRNWTEIEATLKQLDRMPRQVLIEVLVAEITLTDDTKLGIDWALREGRFSFGSTPGTGIPTSSGTLTAPSSILPGAGVGAFGPLAQGLTAFTFETGRFFAILNALASLNRVNVISNPHILTSENKKAVINVSTSVPVVTGQQVPIVGTTSGAPGAVPPTPVGTQSVEYRDAGVILTVTPRIGERGTVALDVKQEVNDIGSRLAPTFSPEIIKREAETSVVLLNNQTLVLGGLIKDKLTTVSQGVPMLKDIPILGYLFGFKERKIEKTELILLITPRVIGTALDAARITDQMRKATPELDQSIKLAPRQPTPMPPPAAPPATPESTR